MTIKNNIQTVSGTKLPFWVKLTASGMGILSAGYGMSNFLRGNAMHDVLIPVFVGAIMIYASGYERVLYINSEGVWRETVFWGQHKLEHIDWNVIADARVILNKGKSIYVLMHGLSPVWPLTFKREQTDEVLAALVEFMNEEDIKIEK